MSVFRCKMCGGTLEVRPGETTGVCEYCGTRQTIPRLDDERRANLYDRAGQFRRNNDYDKASDLYEQILLEDRSDAEAYWSLVLCRYGVEYVEDPKTHKRLPTVNRAQFASVFTDPDYRNAIKYADADQRAIYEAEAAAIEEIQKGILTISQKEKPFDVFICYKETDANGRRTPDSVLGAELYHELTKEGFKVFFSRITLEDKLGTAYEPYIFAALNSAKVMVVIGTRAEYFNAVWVKNEWSRYLALIRGGAKKTLIPAYRDMDPYDLPEEFAHLQAQDMSKLGFMQDLVRGIRKITGVAAPQAGVPAAIPVPTASNTDALLKRVFMFLEDGNYSGADEYCERILDQEPENARAWLGKLMASLHITKQQDLANQRDSFENDPNYRKAARFADEALSAELTGYLDAIRSRKEEERRADAYRRALETESAAATEHSCLAAAELFDALRDYKDARDHAAACRERAETIRKNGVYDKALAEIRAGRFEKAIEIFESISGWRDSEEKIDYCRREIENEKIRAEQARLEAERKAEQARIAKEKRKAQFRRSMRIVIPVLLAAIAVAVGAMVIHWRQGKINEAMAYVSAEDYETGYAKLEKLGLHKRVVQNMKDRAAALIEAEEYEAGYALLEEAGDHEAVLANKYERALALIENKDYEAGYALLDEIGKPEEIEKSKYSRAQVLLASEDYEEGYALLEELGKTEEIEASKYARAQALLVAGDYKAAYALLKELGKTEEIAAGKYAQAMSLLSAGDYDAAYAILQGLGKTEEIAANKYERAVALLADGNYEDAYAFLEELGKTEEIAASKYDRAVALIEKEDYEAAYSLLDGLNYKDSAELLVSLESQIHKLVPLAEARVGAYIEFGTYEQDNDLTNGAEPIEWLVLDKKGGRLLVISRYALDYRQYHNKSTSISWEKCNLRKWLNDEFYSNAFSQDEKGKIYKTVIKAETGEETKDRVFLLSTAEANEYFNSDKNRQCESTEYFHAQVRYNNAYCTWWLRSPGLNTYNAALVLDVGSIRSDGGGVDHSFGVRPAMWISPEPIPKAPSKNTQVGDHVLFGSYEQDNDTSNGKEPIEWLVLDKKDGRILVISRYVLDYRHYHNIAGATWEKCSLRKWLNDDFLNKAFSANERSLIRSTTIKTEGSKDKVFLLSTEEAEQYFDSNKARQCEATVYARTQGSGTWWWLRSPGSFSRFAASVFSGGIFYNGDDVRNGSGVRPALWINLES